MAENNKLICEKDVKGTPLIHYKRGWEGKKFGIEIKKRCLTPGEISLLKPYYKGRVIKYQEIKVIGKSYLPDRIVTPNGNIYFPPDSYAADYSKLPNSKMIKWIFIHEICHAWQWQHDYDVKTNASLITVKGGQIDSTTYKYNSLDHPKLFWSYNMEQQAQMIQDYAMIKNGLKPRTSNSYTLMYLEEVLKTFLDPAYDDKWLLPRTTKFADMDSHNKQEIYMPPKGPGDIFSR